MVLFNVQVKFNLFGVILFRVACTRYELLQLRISLLKAIVTSKIHLNESLVHFWSLSVRHDIKKSCLLNKTYRFKSNRIKCVKILTIYLHNINMYIIITMNDPILSYLVLTSEYKTDYTIYTFWTFSIKCPTTHNHNTGNSLAPKNETSRFTSYSTGEETHSQYSTNFLVRSMRFIYTQVILVSLLFI